MTVDKESFTEIKTLKLILKTWVKISQVKEEVRALQAKGTCTSKLLRTETSQSLGKSDILTLLSNTDKACF